MNRDSNGRFQVGNTGGPGRPPKAVDERYLQGLRDKLTPERWEAIVERAIVDAENGDRHARAWLADRMIGPISRMTEILVDAERASPEPLDIEARRQRVMDVLAQIYAERQEEMRNSG